MPKEEATTGPREAASGQLGVPTVDRHRGLTPRLCARWKRGAPHRGRPIRNFSPHLSALSGLSFCRTQRYLVALTVGPGASSGLWPPQRGVWGHEQQHTFRICPKHTSRAFPFSYWGADGCELILTLLEPGFIFTRCKYWYGINVPPIVTEQNGQFPGGIGSSQQP